MDTVQYYPQDVPQKFGFDIYVRSCLVGLSF